MREHIESTQQQQSPQLQQTEYHEMVIHKVIVTATENSDGANLMEIKSKLSDKMYSLHLEFTKDSTGIGQEIRDTLKEKYIQQEWKSGSLPIEPCALQSPAQEGKGEGQGA